MENQEIEKLILQETECIKNILAGVETPTSGQVLEAYHEAAKKVESEKDEAFFAMGKINENTKPEVINLYNGYTEAAKQDMSAIAYWEYEMEQFIKSYNSGKIKISAKNYCDQIDDNYSQSIAILRQNLYSLIKRIQKIGRKEDKKSKSSFIGKLGYILNRNKKVKKHGEPSQTKDKTLGE